MSENGFVNPSAHAGTANGASKIQISLGNQKSKFSNPLHYFPGIKKANLTYFRFKCVDVIKTIDFYQSLGMNLDSTLKLADGTMLTTFSFIMGSQEMNLNSVKLQFEHRVAPSSKDTGDSETGNPLAKNARSLRGSKAVLGSIGSGGAVSSVECSQTSAAQSDQNATDGQVRSQTVNSSAENGTALPADGVLGFQPKSRRNKTRGQTGDASSDVREVPEPLLKLGFSFEKLRSARHKHEQLIQRAEDYLVVYTHFLARTLTKLTSKSFVPKLSQLENEGVKLAILEDPNGLEVWLMELPDSYLNEGSTYSRQWFGRIGYLALSVPNAQSLVKYYESLLSTAISKAPTAIITKDGLVKTNKAQNTNYRVLNLPGTSAIGRHASSMGASDESGVVRRVGSRMRDAAGGALGEEREGFTVVDCESLTFGLSKLEYSWLANAARETATCLCFVDTKQASGISGVVNVAPSNSAARTSKPEPELNDSQKSMPSSPISDSTGSLFPYQRCCRSTSPFLGVGFQVPALDPAVKLLNQFSVQSLLEQPKYLASGVYLKDKGYVTRMAHPSWLNSSLTITANSEAPPQQETLALAEERQPANDLDNLPVVGWTIDLCSQQKSESKTKGNEPLSEPVSYRINPHYLRGHARSHSAGAVEQVKLEWWARVQLPNPQLLGTTEYSALFAKLQQHNGEQASRQPSVGTSVRQPNTMEKQLLMYNRRHSL